jgi:hypothetical protein
MPQFALTEEFQATNSLVGRANIPPPVELDLTQMLAEIEAVVPPLWPLKDYVAVNPFLGLSEHKFLAARQMLREVRECEMLPTSEYFRAQFRDRQLCRADIESALQQCVSEYPELYAGLNLKQITALLEGGQSTPTTAERRYFTISEIIDRQQQTTWSSHIVNDITRHCSAHYDEGQAAWPNPWKELPLYQAWREAALISRRMDYLGIKGFQSLVGQLPATPSEAIAWLLRELDLVASSQCHSFLLCELYSVAGWASFVKYRVREAALAGQRDEDLIGLLAIRLAYDVALARAQSNYGSVDREQLAADAVSLSAGGNATIAPPLEVLARYLLQVAAETAYRQKLLGTLTSRLPAQRQADRKAAQLIFCIDVRSEVMRRHLESLSDSIETFGFAGFFGMALEYVPLGEAKGVAQCPVLLSPGFRIQETVSGAGDLGRDAAILARREQRIGRKVWKSFQNSAVTCFSFVESLGLLYIGKLLTDSLLLTRPVKSPEKDGLPRDGSLTTCPDLHTHGKHALSLAKKTDLAEGMLRNLGLTEGFARIVTICGHAAEVVNNPYKAGLDCGACGGHSGEPNARVAAALLNDPQVRSGLETRGICVPDDTWFVPAVHNTTTDEIQLLDTANLPETHASEFTALQDWIQEAGRLCRTERSLRLNGSTSEDIFRRSRDWAEVRPEWGLAGNAAFIVAPRSRTAGLNLGGRTFMHSYDQQKDPELKVLELIMTAPMIVTSWINLQYYASAVDNRAFGSGNKVIHNVVGQLGVLLGNGGDLMTGLPWQSVHDGERFQHEPLRLLVVIEATRNAVQRIIDKHPLVCDLVSNGWLSLVVLEDELCYRWNAAGEWEPESLTASSKMPFEQTTLLGNGKGKEAGHE